jgi:exodeoxyribonuclease-5
VNWSPQQQRALNDVGRWLGTKDDALYYLAGFAGTGKTTLAKHLAEGTDKVLFAAYTGKAASVMRKRGCPLASTIHQLIYLPSSRSKLRLLDLEEQLWEVECETPMEDRATNSLILKLKKQIEEEKQRLKRPAFTLNPESSVKEANLVVIDECSMVDEKMGMDLLSFKTPVLVLGDPAQLPPVKGGGFFTHRQPNMMLTEIHRQAWDSPILTLATKVRMGESLEDGQYGESMVMRGKPDQDLVMKADQILVGKNETRRKCNSRMRFLLGYNSTPVPDDGGFNVLPVKGDKLVCLRNDHMEGLLNGTIWTVDEVSPGACDNRICLTVTNEDDQQTTVEAHTHYFEGREEELPYYEIREAQCFDYGYALTAHKAQGSQWSDVFVFDESYVFRGSAKQWLYTAITRASERVIVCRN